MGAALILALALAGGGRFERVNSRTEQGRSDRGLMSSSGALFEFAPLSGAGMGTACACAAVTGAKGEALTFSRASVAECPSSDGQSWTQCAAHAPRVSYSFGVLSLLSERSATNLLQHSRDLSQAAWVKTNMTCVRAATGMRGDINGASTCTATGAAATVCQTVTTAAAVRASSWQLMRRTGTGAVAFSRDGVSYSSDYSGSLSAVEWRRAVPSETSGCMSGQCVVVPELTGSVLNPQICMRLSVPGDAVDVDFVQDESGQTSTSVIETGAASASRASDVAYVEIPSSKLVSLRAWGDSGSAKSQYAGLLAAWQSGTVRTWLNQGGTATTQDQYMQCYFRTGTDYVANSYTFFNTTFTGSTPFNCEFAGGVGTSSVHGYVATTALAYTPQSFTRVYIGGLDVDGNQWNGFVNRVCVDTEPGRCAPSWTHPTSDVAMVGNSITRADTTGAPRPPYTVALTTQRNVYNLGVPADTAAQCRSRFDASVVGKGYGTLVVECSVNSLNNGLTAAATWADLGYIAETARSQGLQVRLVDTLPWATYAGWTAGKGAEDDALRATMLAYCAAHSPQVQCVDTDALGTGAPLALQAGYDFGDHLHLNAAGNAALAALVAASVP